MLLEETFPTALEKTRLIVSEDTQQSSPEVFERFMITIVRTYKRFIWLCLLDL